MNNTTLQVKFKKRLNKIDSQDYDNIQSWEIAEAFNKAQIEWCRRQLSGTNMRQEGDEQSKRRIDDLSILLKSTQLTGADFIYDEQFGYFQSSNFGNIYNPELGGDYLEFKRIECNSQQCFPYVEASTLTELIDVETTPGYTIPGSTVPGYWAPGEMITTGGYYTDDVNTEIFTVVRLPVFTFFHHGMAALTINRDPWDNNQISTWGSLGNLEPTYCTPPGGDCSMGGLFPGVPGGNITTQEPWVWNQNMDFEYVVYDSVSWTPPGIFPGNYETVYNQDIIIPWKPNTDTNGDGVSDACHLCNNNAETIVNDDTLLGYACNGNSIGWLVGGPQNEWINCNGGGAGVATWAPIFDLNAEDDADGIFYDEAGEEVLTYNYTNTPNTWVNNSQAVFGQAPPDEFCTSACWFKPANVENVGFSLNNWQTTPGEWIPETTEPGPEVWVDPVTTDPVVVDPVIEQQEQITNIPFSQCYCAPGANQDNFCTKPRSMTVYQSEVANVDVILRDPLKRPDFEWSETFCTFRSDNSNPQIRIWRKDFYVMDPVLVYYRVPRRIQIAGSIDPYTGILVAEDVNSEFKDDIVEVMIDSAVGIIAGDISDANQMGRGPQESEKNN